MIVWGGATSSAFLNTGGRYNPTADTWTAVTTTGAPVGRQNLTSVWSGTEMIVWGGVGASGNSNDGGRYTPATNSWMPVSSVGVPPVRYSHTAVWTGSLMIIHGGYNGAALSDLWVYAPSREIYLYQRP
jgi:N-acetylneuraminic acid mutarotase